MCSRSSARANTFTRIDQGARGAVQRMPQIAAQPFAIEFAAKQFARRRLQAIQVQVQPAHAAVLHAHDSEVAIVGLREMAQIVHAHRPAVQFQARRER